MTDIVITPDTFGALREAIALADDAHFLLQRIEIRPRPHASQGGARDYHLKLVSAFANNGLLDTFSYTFLDVRIAATASALGDCMIDVRCGISPENPDHLQVMILELPYQAINFSASLKSINDYVKALKSFGFTKAVTLCASYVRHHSDNDNPHND